MVEFFRRRSAERDDLDALRVDARHDVLDRGILAGRVHRLEHDQKRVSVTRPQQLLGVGKGLLALCERVARPRTEFLPGQIREVRAACPRGIASRNAGCGARLDHEVLQQPLADVSQARSHALVSPPEWTTHVACPYRG